MNFEDFEYLINNKLFVLAYFTQEQCNVCKVLFPKIKETIEKEFSRIELIRIDTVKNPETAGQNSVFAVPTIIFFIEGKEHFRRSRNIGISELKDLISRPYSMIE